jgi:peptidoglycan/LPS O-acetylase OafA/YrhL
MDKNKRMANIEMLRFLAMLFIITGHLLGENGADLLGKTELFSLEWYILWGIEAVCVSGTNCFVLISGYFLIDSVFRWKKVVSLCLQVWFYSILLFTVSVLLGLHSINLSTTFKALTPILGRNWWFISTYLALYILSPYINKFINSLNEKEHRGFVVILVILFSVISTVYPFADSFGSGAGSGLVWFSTLYTIAAYIRKYPLKARFKILTKCCFYFLFVSFILLSKYIISFATNVLLKKTFGTSLFYTNSSILNLGASVFLFMLFLDLDISSKKIIAVTRWLGGVTFGVYMLHNNPWVSSYMWKQILLIPHQSIIAILCMVIIVPIAIYLTCGLIETIRRKIFLALSKLSIKKH